MKHRAVSVAMVASMLLASGVECLAGPRQHEAAQPVVVTPRLFAVPVFEPGKIAWVSVYDQLGHPVPSATVLVNGTAIQADNMGQATFTVPDGDKLTLSVQVEGGNPSPVAEYQRTPGGYLVAEKQAREAVDRIEESVVSNERAPTIAYAPSAVETSQPFVLIGKNLSGKADGDHVLIDGYDADVFSGSSVCLLATTPRRLSLGALREMYVTTGDETSNTVEVDVCRVEATLVPPSAVGSAEQVRIRAIGTNVPSLIEVRNPAPDMVALAFSQKRLGKRSALITAGGDNNSAYLDVVRKDETNIDLDTHLVADAPWSPDDRTTFGDADKRAIVAELNKAEVIRLKRRLIAIEERIAEEQKHRTEMLSAGTLTPFEMDKINAQLRTLSNRQRRINAMVVARRAVFQALGGTEVDYRKALDDAAGGGAIALEKCLAPLTSAALLASTNAAQSNGNPMAANVASINLLAMDREKEMHQLAELTRLWKKMPSKVGHSTRLAPPPPPYVPDLTQVTGDATYNYASLVKLGAPPPPPPLVALMKRNQMKRRATKASRATKRLRPRSKSRRR